MTTADIVTTETTDLTDLAPARRLYVDPYATPGPGHHEEWRECYPRAVTGTGYGVTVGGEGRVTFGFFGDVSFTGDAIAGNKIVYG